MSCRSPYIEEAQQAISQSLIEIASPYNDGWTASTCKHELYMLKCWLEDEYRRLPTFSGEELWEADRAWNLLKQQ